MRRTPPPVQTDLPQSPEKERAVRVLNYAYLRRRVFYDAHIPRPWDGPYAMFKSKIEATIVFDKFAFSSANQLSFAAR